MININIWRAQYFPPRSIKIPRRGRRADPPRGEACKSAAVKKVSGSEVLKNHVILNEERNLLTLKTLSFRHNCFSNYSVEYTRISLYMRFVRLPAVGGKCYKSCKHI